MSFVRNFLPWQPRPRIDPAADARIREALLDLCFECGFPEVDEAALCRRAGVPPAAFRRSYQDLEECFAQVYEVIAREFMLAMLEAFDADLSWRDQIRAVAYAFLGFLTADERHAHFTVVEPFHAGERALVVRDQVFTGLFALIDQGRNELADPDSLTPATAEAVGGAIFRQLRIVIEERRFDDLAALVPLMMHQVVLPYLGPEAAAEELTFEPQSH